MNPVLDHIQECLMYQRARNRPPGHLPRTKTKLPCLTSSPAYRVDSHENSPRKCRRTKKATIWVTFCSLSSSFGVSSFCHFSFDRRRLFFIKTILPQPYKQLYNKSDSHDHCTTGRVLNLYCYTFVNRWRQISFLQCSFERNIMFLVHMSEE